jgi:uncharacterized protein (TIGR02594 family)
VWGKVSLKELFWQIVYFFRRKSVLPSEQNPELPEWYKIALKERGIKEGIGVGNNERILEYHSVTKLHAKDDSVPWCAAFVSWCLEECGIESTKSASSRSYIKWGQAVETPYEGCIVVLARGDNPNNGHVGFYVGSKNGLIYILGGNQSDAVNVMPFLLSRVVAFREPLNA